MYVGTYNSHKSNHCNKNSMSFTDCTGLKAEWTSTLETTTQFPVDPGTVVEVTCSDSYATNSGSSEITCKTDRLFTYQQEPHCTVPGN